MALFGNNSQNNFKVGTGNAIADILLGGVTGLSDATQSRGQYVPMFNWQGNGIARGGIQYLANPNYRDYASGGRMLGAALGNLGGLKSKFDFNDLKNELSNMLDKPMFHNFTSGRNLNYPLKTESYQLPQIGNIGGNTVGDYGDEYNKNVYDYSLPTQYTNFKLPWE